MTFIQALFIGLLQGATELFPVSSLGHAVIVPVLLHWSYRETDPQFLPFLVLLHLGTATALFILYWRDWLKIIAGLYRASVRGRIEDEWERLGILLVVGTIPTGVIAVLLQKRIQALFASPRFAATLLVVNGLILLGAEVLRRRDERRRRATGGREAQEARYADIWRIGFPAAIAIGLSQSLALMPGISRSGVTMAGGLLVGLRHQEAVRFTFLLATPIIGAAGIAEVPELLTPGTPIGTYLAAAVVAGLAAYASARFLVRWFREGRLDPYAIYCIAAGIVSLALLR